ncbi:hypothetical protein TVAG_297330 [Trichomonas vaginalis G3]|uniref:t-SNARE coiled-coil homology domain-containing protein n=1 Tax=Trichomonas vaginalis (strain ATCC PRA-98 / G3) TaxID=412133 RepID=A2DRC8_TRIV3|nr:t-snare proteins family [Trichomonas vaginalis G3]EAY17054.1 hypothetical protein TVAG_297330 [Trichomonas vaginalis G3]KAI5517924.1 t-snare proteins family [Trichomonas vaginalis G3]|eukprot:XP_001329277.1 hypothetical protein [Trichomonas vaginalis G3]
MIDPFIVAQQDVISDMEKINTLLSTRNDMIHDSRGINVDIFNNLGVQSQNLIQNVKENLSDLDGAFQQILKNPSRFDISESELTNRKNFLASYNQKLAQFENQLNEQNSHQFPQYMSNIQGYPSYDSEKNPKGDQQSQLYQEHSEQIDAIADNVTAGLLLGRTINAELADQEQLISALDDDVTNASEAMQKVTKEIKALIEAEGKTPTCLVCILSVIFIVLLFFVI